MLCCVHGKVGLVHGRGMHEPETASIVFKSLRSREFGNVTHKQNGFPCTHAHHQAENRELVDSGGGQVVVGGTDCDADG